MTDPAPRPCPRSGCQDRLTHPDHVVCTGDFHLLAGRCRGKKRIGEPVAAQIEFGGRGIAYSCSVCRQWHNGGAVKDPYELHVLAHAIVQAMKNDLRVGRRGISYLADAWRPELGLRFRWWEGLDQKDAYQ